MKITSEWLKERSACAEGVEWFNKRDDVEPLAVLKALICDDKLDWANWLIVRVMTRPQRLRYAIYAAEQVLPIFEKKYPSDGRPRKAIEAAKNFLAEENRMKSKEAEAEAAGEAARAAAVDAAAAIAAVEAAWAARAAAWAAEAAGEAARAVEAALAVEAAWAAAKGKMQLRILNYGIGLLNAEDKP